MKSGSKGSAVRVRMGRRERKEHAEKKAGDSPVGWFPGRVLFFWVRQENDLKN